MRLRAPSLSDAFIGCIVAVVVASSGCKTTLRSPDLGGIYNRSAQFHDPTRNPIIVIPGMLGSKLVDSESDQIVWGAFGGGAANPRKPKDARTIALPMEEGLSFRELRDTVVSDGALDRISVRLFGLPLQLDAYFYILSTLGVGGYRDELLGKLGAIDYGDNHYTCFQFDYDWRRDNVENAQGLHKFILQKRAYVRAEVKRRYGVDNPNVKFDVVAHSMGGLVLRYMLRYGNADMPDDGSAPDLTWAGAPLVERAILIAPPNAGAVEALDQLLHGVRFSPFFPRYQPAVIGTYPSLYQLLPRARHSAVIDAETGEALDTLDPALWEAEGWGLASHDQARVLEMLLPAETEAGRRRIALDHQRKSLNRARQFHSALDIPARPPDGLELYLVAGDAKLTGAVVAVEGGGQSSNVVERRPGDGTILRSSALMDERVGGEWVPTLSSPIEWRAVNFVFKDHLGITNDLTFTDNLLYLLLESQR